MNNINQVKLNDGNDGAIEMLEKGIYSQIKQEQGYWVLPEKASGQAVTPTPSIPYHTRPVQLIHPYQYRD
jgi:hypothetical protein